MKMKKYITIVIVVCCTTLGAFAQKNVGIGTTTPNQSAMLDIESLEKGLLIPRMHTAERLNIVNPAKSLIVFDLDLNKFCFFDTLNVDNKSEYWQILTPQVASGSLILNNVFANKDTVYDISVNTPQTSTPEINYLVNAVISDATNEFNMFIKYARVVDANTVRLRIKSEEVMNKNIRINYVILKVN